MCEQAPDLLTLMLLQFLSPSSWRLVLHTCYKQSVREDFLWTVKWHKKACTGSLCHTPNLQKDWESHSYKD